MKRQLITRPRGHVPRRRGQSIIILRSIFTGTTRSMVAFILAAW
ncbi:MAG: hypothetical protein ACTSQP_22610 [Promethearchaeota archaeon]